MDHPIIEEESLLLRQVRTLLEEVPYLAPPRERDLVADLVRLREELPSAKEEDRGALLAQYNQQLAVLEQLRASRDRPDVDPDSPYFAHLRLVEGGKVRDLCIGKATRIQQGVRIVDWRHAPVSRIFYRYQQGEEYEEEVGDVVLSGKVAARRTVTVRSGELQRVEAPEGVFARDEGEWSRSEPSVRRLAGGERSSLSSHLGSVDRRLGTDLRGHHRRIDKRLPDIAGLIDPEQFDLITRPSAGFVVVRGTAGSGKTTVALHRVAYLAYQDPSLDSDRTLVLVFSRGLKDYVSHVLPGLGVHRVRVDTFDRWALRTRKRHLPQIPEEHCGTTPAVVVRLKLHPVTMEALKLQIEGTKAPASARQVIDDWGSALSNHELLSGLFRERAPGAFTDAELQRATSWCRERYELLMDWLEEHDEEDRFTPDHEDEALLLRAWQIRVGPLKDKGQRPLVYRHLVIDEVQDFSPIDVRVLLGCLDARQSVTLAGDTQQHVMVAAGFTSWEEFFGHLGVQGTHVDTLKVAYRSSKEIVDFALEVLGDLREDKEPPLTVRSGPEVELFRFTDHGAAVAFLAEALRELVRTEPLASVALLAPSPAVAAMYFEGLATCEVPALRLVTEQDFTFLPGIEVCEVREVKGLEFDYVVLLEVSAHEYPDTPAARRLLHVGATRAVHQLWLTAVGALSPIVPPVDADAGDK